MHILQSHFVTHQFMNQVMNQFMNQFMPYELVCDSYTLLRLHVRTYGCKFIGSQSMKVYES